MIHRSRRMATAVVLLAAFAVAMPGRPVPASAIAVREAQTQPPGEFASAGGTIHAGALTTELLAPLPCSDVLIVGARGSGEKLSQNRGFGPRASWIRDTIRRSVGDQRLVTEWAIGSGPENYPAHDVSVLGTELGKKYFAGVESGVDAAVARLTTQRSSCRHQQFALTGYSQGAMVIHRALVKLKDRRDILDRIVGVALLADGDQRPFTRAHLVGDELPPKDGNGITQNPWPFTQYKYREDIPPRVAERVWSHCENGDLVCDFDLGLSGWSLAAIPIAGTIAVKRYRTGKRIHLSPAYQGSGVDLGIANGITRRIKAGPRIGFSTLPPATIGTSYHHQLKTVDNRGGRWTISGDLPPINFNGVTGTFDGAPYPDAAPRTYTFTLQLKDDGGLTATREVTLALADVTTDDRWATVSVRRFHTCGVTTDGSAWCWGDNTSGQLGDGTSTQRLTPTRVGAWANWVSVTVGFYHSCGVWADGTAWCWGDNTSGQLGDGTTDGRLTPTRVEGPSNWVSLAAGESHSCGVRADGTAWCWGDNTSGQLGDGTTTRRLAPTQVGASSDWVSVTVGWYHACGVRADGTAWCWGENSNGQLGDGTTTRRLAPTRIGGSSDWASLTTGLFHSCGLKAEGSSWCWGDDGTDVLGDERLSPIRVGASSDWTTLSAAGWAHSCGLNTAGSVWCWGYNDWGQLGDGTTIQRLSPTRVGTTSDWTSVSAGWGYSCGVRADGTAWCWGYNAYGQLGDATTMDRLTPTQVIG